MAILNARQNLYQFKFPEGWFYKELLAKYNKILQKKFNNYISVNDWVNSTIQSVSLPEISIETIKQSFKNIDRTFKGGYDAERYFNKELTINFKLTEGFLNYFLLLEQLLIYMDLRTDNKAFLPDLTVQLLDNFGEFLFQIQFLDIVYKNLSALNPLSYASVGADFNTFSISIGFKTLVFNDEILLN